MACHENEQQQGQEDTFLFSHLFRPKFLFELLVVCDKEDVFGL
jgi:hypothetical protein